MMPAESGHPRALACQRRTTMTSNCVAVGGKPVSNFAFATARRPPKRATVVGNWNRGLVMVLFCLPERKSLFSFQTLIRLSLFWTANSSWLPLIRMPSTFGTLMPAIVVLAPVAASTRLSTPLPEWATMSSRRL